MKIFALPALAVGFALGLLFVAGKVLTRRLETESGAAAPWGPGTSFLATRSGRVHILDAGEGPAILLVHGSGRSVADWQDELADQLARDHRVVGFDSYGFGLIDRNHPFVYGNALWARQAIDVLDALEIQRAVFGDTFSEQHRQRAEGSYRIRGTRAALLTFIRRQYTIDGLRLLRGTYEDIEIPVLQVHGTLDESIPIDAARALSARLRDTRFVAVEGSSHDVHVDAPDRLAEEVATFVATLEP